MTDLYEKPYGQRASLAFGALTSLILPRRRKLPTLLTWLLVGIMFITWNHYNTASRAARTFADNLRYGGLNGFENISDRLHLIIPASTTNDELCKAVLSSAILGYPTPVFLNWGKPAAENNWEPNGAWMQKITGTLEYLETLKPENDNEIVLVMDGFDAWMQLRPDVMISRYRNINRKLFERTVKMMGHKAVQAEGVKQSIIFSAQKSCGPGSEPDEIACYAQPESPLPRDAYGPDTDVLEPSKHLPLHFRPHWLCSGVVMGSVFEMRELYQDAKERIHHGEHKGGDQHIFNELFGEQQYQREVMRVRHQSFLTRLGVQLQKALGLYTPSIIDPHPTHQSMRALPGRPREYGIGLDYELEISQSAVLSEFDGSWFVFNDEEDTRRQQVEAQHDPPKLTRLPDDIILSPYPHPFEELKHHASAQVVEASANVTALGWGDVPLYGNVWVGSVPAIIHMNGFKSMRGAIWDRMWYFNNTRQMLEVYTRTRHLGAYTPKGEWLPWDSLCGTAETELFRDGKGPFHRPEDRR